MATKDQATPGPPQRLPRDPVTTPCELDAGGETFHWDPEEDLNLMRLGEMCNTIIKPLDFRCFGAIYF
jgi:hypothetical protein